MIQSTFGLERRQIEWLRRRFGHSRMSAGLRAIIDEAMDESPMGEEDDSARQHTDRRAIQNAPR